ncbi:MAG: hypothetical protein MUC81_02385 [Bacteroidia bacterium]|jgi:hypothetical protein|nr:hypothetical protein [Bacteroidia bacterium]
METIDKKIQELNNEIENISKSLRFAEAFEFSMSSFENIPWEKMNCQGLYFIEIKNDNKYSTFKEWIDNFCEVWLDSRYEKKFTSNPKKMRIGKHSELKEWFPLYIGKSKKIKNRVLEHIHLELHKPTFGLKLKVRENMQEAIYRVSYLNIQTANYDWIMPRLEKSLRDFYNPIVGRQ